MSLHNTVTSSDFVQCNETKLYREPLKTKRQTHTNVTSSDFEQCNGTKLYREPMKTKSQTHTTVTSSDFYKNAISCFIKIDPRLCRTERS